MEQRLSRVEKDLEGHARVLTGHNDTLDEHRLRILAIEAARQARKEEEIRREANADARDAALNVRLDTQEKKLDSVSGAMSRVTWIIISAVLGAALTFLLSRGGL